MRQTKLADWARLLAATALIGVAASTAAAAWGNGADDTLSLNASFSYAFISIDCPAGTSEATNCFAYSGLASIPGLGRVSISYVDRVDVSNPGCVRDTTSDGSMAAGRGGLIFSLAPPPGAACLGLGPGTIPLAFTITGGSGSFAAATGQGTLTLHDESGGKGFGTWDGTLSVPGYSFDTTPPVLSGAVDKSISIARRARAARVRFSVTAIDAVDGAVGVTCTPASGSLFRVGVTRVRCSAVDSSENATTASFKITIRRKGK